MFKQLFSAFLGAQDPASNVDVTQAHALQKEGAQLIDVRESYEFRSGHAKGARSIPLSQLHKRMGEIRADKTVLVICQSGNRSRTARSMLQRQPFTDVRNVLGGTSAWQRAKLPMQ
jgi:rhodanese-related sulfurtransferase